MKIKDISPYSDRKYKIKELEVYTMTDRGYNLVAGQFKDMIRYDNCFINKADLAKVKNDHEQHSIRLLFITTTGRDSLPTFDRWRSFWIYISQKPTEKLSTYELESSIDEWVTLVHTSDYSGYQEIPLKGLVSA